MTQDQTAPTLHAVDSGSAHRVVLDVDVLGKGRIEIDGHDVSDVVSEVHLRTAPREITQVVVVTTPTAGARFDGYARVSVGEPHDPGPAAATFLGAIDPETLQREALHRLDLGTSETATTEAILSTLIEWAEGKA